MCTEVCVKWVQITPGRCYTVPDRVPQLAMSPPQPHSKPPTLTLRITVENCDDESLAVSIQRFKVVTLVAQILAIAVIVNKALVHRTKVGWSRCHLSTHSIHVRGDLSPTTNMQVEATTTEHAAHVVVIAFNILGALHSLSIVLCDSSSGPWIPLLAVEFVYSLYTTFLFAALGLVIQLSLRFHRAAFPHAVQLQQQFDGRAATLTVLVFSLVLLISMGTDMVVAIVMDEYSVSSFRHRPLIDIGTLAPVPHPHSTRPPPPHRTALLITIPHRTTVSCRGHNPALVVCNNMCVCGHVLDRLECRAQG